MISSSRPNSSGNDDSRILGGYILSNNVRSLTLTGPGAIAWNQSSSAANPHRQQCAANRLDGSRGQDTLEGGAGNDTLSSIPWPTCSSEAADGNTDLVAEFRRPTRWREFEDLQRAGSGNLKCDGERCRQPDHRQQQGKTCSTAGSGVPSPAAPATTPTSPPATT